MKNISTIFLALIAVSALALQKPERHFGCPAGKNVCIYPIDDANLQCETIFDFQVALHIPLGGMIQPQFRHEIDIKLTLPSGDILTPESLFGKEPELRNWTFLVQEDLADRNPKRFKSYATTYRNVVIHRKYGSGLVEVTVHARGVTTKVTYILHKPTKRRAKNVVLFIGDGMALPMMAAARLVSRGMYNGKYNDTLNIEKFPYLALQNPAGVDSIITDSANSATSFNTGQKSSFGALGVYGDSGDDNFAHPKQETIAEHIKRRFGMSVGVVTTSEIQDATPGAVWAHVRRREEKAAITAQAINGCQDCVLAVQPDVIMGGGGKYFKPMDSIDGSDMYANFSAKGYTVTHTRAEMMAAANDERTEKLLTISHNEDMEVWLDRNIYTDNMNDSSKSPTVNGPPPTDQPNLDEMVMAAIKVLSKNENGFYLMAEAASIDTSAHNLDIPRTLSDLIELDNTVGKVKKWAKEHGDDTLIMVTADHGHGFDVFGTVDTNIWDLAVFANEEGPVSDVDNYCSAVTDNIGRVFNVSVEPTTGMPLRESNIARRLAIGSYAFAGYPDYMDSNGDGFPDTWDVRTTLAAGMNNFPDHTEDYKVSPSMKRPAAPASLRFLSNALGVPDVLGFVNNPSDDPNGIFLSGNIASYLPTGVHTTQDVGLFAYGPGAEKVGGIMDNTEVFHIIASALGFGTDGDVDADNHLFNDVIRCKHDGDSCHCGEAGEGYVCACARNGPPAFVLPTTKLCSLKGSKIMPM
ncbi:Intestinal-type alkaline phosphatase [Gracilariopsis chorda]|uniref:alkaline phosphatase n=1 Tax=Gracilariopsis chorda TaxID=448386 RepID=A0A2V3INU5_9FLOR|nr:Intestinal-type alkaline phosphatase [Gracilariopsis chorda]|eukprot:PXF43755.1 Intestinal-type alkaline phosphatase [Gracilariopsis chorda]